MAEPILKYPLRAFLDLSTGHLTIKTREWLNAKAEATSMGLNPERWIAATPYGWFVYADEEPKEENFPADLIACMVEARKRGAEYILFDADAEALDPESLPYHGDDE